MSKPSLLTQHEGSSEAVQEGNWIMVRRKGKGKVVKEGHGLIKEETKLIIFYSGDLI
jgi:hypothetical protein